MQIGSVSPDYSPSVPAQQPVLPPLPDVSLRKDKDSDHDGGATGANPTTPASNKQVNVVA